MDPHGPSCTCLVPSVVSSSDSLMSASHQADVMLAPGSLQVASIGSLCRWGGLGLIIISNFNLSWVMLILGWVVTTAPSQQFVSRKDKQLFEEEK